MRKGLYDEEFLPDSYSYDGAETHGAGNVSYTVVYILLIGWFN